MATRADLRAISGDGDLLKAVVSRVLACLALKLPKLSFGAYGFGPAAILRRGIFARISRFHEQPTIEIVTAAGGRRLGTLEKEADGLFLALALNHGHPYLLHFPSARSGLSPYNHPVHAGVVYVAEVLQKRFNRQKWSWLQCQLGASCDGGISCSQPIHPSRRLRANELDR